MLFSLFLSFLSTFTSMFKFLKFPHQLLSTTLHRRKRFKRKKGEEDELKSCKNFSLIIVINESFFLALVITSVWRAVRISEGTQGRWLGDNSTVVSSRKSTKRMKNQVILVADYTVFTQLNFLHLETGWKGEQQRNNKYNNSCSCL